MTVIRELFMLLGLDIEEQEFAAAEKAMERVEKVARRLTKTVQDLAAVVRVAGQQLSTGLKLDFVEDEYTKAEEALGRLARSARRVDRGFQGVAGAVAAAGEKLASGTGGAVQVTVALDGMGAAAGRAGQGLRRTKEDVGAAAQSFDDLVDDVSGLGDSFEDLEEETTQVGEVIEDLEDDFGRLGDRFGETEDEVAGLTMVLEGLGASTLPAAAQSMSGLEKQAAALGIALVKPNGEMKTAKELAEEVAKKFKELQGDVKSAASELQSFAQKLALGVGAVAGAVSLAVYRYAQAGDAAAKTGKRLNITAEEVQELGYVAKASGASTEALEKSVLNLGRRAAEAARGNKAQRETLRDLGISATDANGKVRPTLDLLEELADKIASIEDPGRQASLVMRALGDGGAVLLPFLKEGAAGIATLRQRARDLGGFISNEDAAAAEALSDALSDVRVVLDGIVNRFGARVGPTFQRMADLTTRWWVANRELVDLWLDRFAKAIEVVARGLSDIGSNIAGLVGNGDRLATMAQMLAVVLGAVLATKVGVLAIAIGKYVTALKTMTFWQALAAAKPMLIGAAILFLVAAITDFVETIQGKDTLLRRFIEDYIEAPNPEGAFLPEVFRFAAVALKGLVEATREFIGLFSSDNAAVASAQQYWMTFWDPVFAYWSKQFASIPVLRELVGMWKYMLGGGLGEDIAGLDIAGNEWRRRAGLDTAEDDRLNPLRAKAREDQAQRNIAAGIPGWTPPTVPGLPTLPSISTGSGGVSIQVGDINIEEASDPRAVEQAVYRALDRAGQELVRQEAP